MPSIQVKEIKSWLETKNIKVPNEWVGACLSWLSEISLDQGFTGDKIKEAVYHQWLYTDLQTLENPILPASLFTTEKIFLEGTHALQINYMYDISQPAYAQLSKLTGTINENASVTAAVEEPPPPWEAKPTRMLLVTFTDGINSIDGFEFVPVPELHLGLPPGTKVLLTGPIECLGQRLFLTPKNVKVLGGAVEDLLATNTQEQILTQLLCEKGLVMEPAQAATTSLSSLPPPIDLNELEDDDVFTNPEVLEQIDQQIQEVYTQNGSENLPQEENHDIEEDYVGRSLNEDYDPLDEIDDEVLRDHYDFQDNEENPKSPSLLDRKLPSKEMYLEFAKPYTYLSLIKNKLELAAPIIIKGFIVTLLSKLEISAEKWSIQAIVTDGSESLHVSLHDQLLSKLIGHTAEEVIAIKSKAPQDQDLKKKVMSAIQGCQQSLLNLNGLLKIDCIQGRFFLLDSLPLGEMEYKQLAERLS